jgi:hypothetical protein
MADSIHLLAYNPPSDWAWMSSFLQARALAGIESFEKDVYRRTLAINAQGVTTTGWLSWRRLEVAQLRSIGIQVKRAACLIGVAQAVESGALSVDNIEDTRRGIGQLVAMPGIGVWTAHYVAMRAWGERDIFLPSDYLIKQRFPNMTPGAINRYAEIWKPWRSYAALLIWNNPNWKP